MTDDPARPREIRSRPDPSPRRRAPPGQGAGGAPPDRRAGSRGAVFAALAESLAVVSLWLALAVAGRSAMLRDPGTFWHIAAGEWMLDHGRVVRTDPFSFTRGGRPWVADQWLAECAMALLWRVGGWDALVVSAAALVAAVYGWAALRVAGAGAHPLAALAALVVAVAAGAPQFHARPLLISMVLLPLSFALLVEIEARRRSLLWLLSLPPLMLVWANLHPMVLGGLGTLVLGAAAWTGARWLGRASPLSGPRDLLAVWATVAASGLAVLVNPYGVALPRAWMAVVSMPLAGLIEEHARLSLRAPSSWAVFALAAVYVWVWTRSSAPRSRATWLIPAVWFVLTLLRSRNAPLFALVTLVALADMLPHWRAPAWLSRRDWLRQPGAKGSAPRPARGARVAWLVLAIAWGAAMLIQAAGWRAPLVGSGFARLDPAHWPLGLIDELRAVERGVPEGEPLFNDLRFGGLVIRFAPRLRVFIDDRCALYGGDFLKAYDRARREDPAALEPWRRQYDFRFALVETGGEFDGWLARSPDWILLRRTAPAALYRRLCTDR